MTRRTTNLSTTSYWATSATCPQFAKLAEDVETDVVVVGAGVTGLTTAYLLVKAGKRVVVLERDRCATADTGHTSAHLTMVTDARLTDLVKQFGRDHAQAVWDKGLAAIYYLRVEPHRDCDVVIFGGEDHKTGQQDDTVACHEREPRPNRSAP